MTMLFSHQSLSACKDGGYREYGLLQLLLEKNELITSKHPRGRCEAIVKGFKLLNIQPVGEHGNAVQDN